MKQLWTYLALGLICLLAACSFTNEQTAAPTTQARPTAEATTVASRPTSGLPTPTFVTTGAQPPASTQPAPSGSPTEIVLDDTTWLGGYRRASGNTVYGGRTAAWIYGSSTEFSTMQAAFNLPQQPSGTAELSIEGMDSEGGAKTPIRISVNGAEIFSGPNPLPDDDLPLDSGTWSSYTWRFDAGLLRPGPNSISISNLAPGAFSRPPFFMLDYAIVTF